MIRLLVVIIFVGLNGIVTFGQKSPFKFGDISMDEMQMNSYKLDSSASAVVLFDYGDAHIDIDMGKMIFERYARIKILRKEGFDEADIAIPLYHDGSTKESIGGLKAYTYNLVDGKIEETKLTKDGVFEERINKYYDNQKFTFPNVKEGSIIEYSYKLYSDFWVNFPNWEFQSNIPIAYSEYRARIPDFFIYERYMQGYLSISDYTKKAESKQGYTVNTHRWVLKDVPAFKAEPHMTCEDDYIAKINFALSHISFPGEPVRDYMGSWAKMNNDYLESEYFGKVVDGSGFLKKKTEELTAGIDDPLKKLTVIYDYIKESIEWNKDKDRTVDNTNLKKVFDERKGNCAEINLALASMLRKAGIEVDPVLLSTKNHGFVREQYPMTRQFNYVICAVKINDKVMLVDATERLLPMDILPERCLNEKGLVISKTNSRWISLRATTKSRTTVVAKLDLSSDSRLEGGLEYARSGYDALETRKAYLSKGKDEYMKEVFGAKSWEISESEFKGFDSPKENPIESHTISISDHVNEAGNVIYIDPFVTLKTSENPFKSEKREYPVDFGSASDEIYILNLKVPDNIIVDELPLTKVLALPDNGGKYTYNVAQIGNTITVTSMLSINKAIFTQMEYPILREFYSQVVAKQTEQIVLKKK